jgi:hypothetical protein
VLFAYLVLHRGRALPRDELLVAGWGEEVPAEAGNALSVLLSKLRHALGAEQLRGRTEVELLLPRETFVDVEAAMEGAHRAETCIAEGRWAAAWARPGSPTTSAPGRSSPGWRRPGSTVGADPPAIFRRAAGGRKPPGSTARPSAERPIRPPRTAARRPPRP